MNLLGSLGIGVCVALSSAAGAGGWSPAMRHATMTGLLGGFTTFSTFSVQTMTLLQEGHWMAAAANAVSSVVLGVMACAAGYSAVVALAR